MKEINDFSREELLEVIKIKDSMIAELQEELDIYMELCRDLSEGHREDNDKNKA